MANFSYFLKNFSVIVNDSKKLQKSCEDTHLKNYLMCERGIFTHWWQGCKFVLKKILFGREFKTAIISYAYLWTDQFYFYKYK